MEQAPESKAAPVELLSCESPHGFLMVFHAFMGPHRSPKWVFDAFFLWVFDAFMTHEMEIMFDPTLGRGDP